MAPLRRKNNIRKKDNSDVSSDCLEDENEYKKLSINNTQVQKVDLKKVLVRTVTASTLAIFFLGLLQTGHLYCIFAGVLTQAELFRELVNVRYAEAKERKMPLFRTLQWSWFLLAMFYSYGETFHTFCLEHKQLMHLTKITQFIDTIVFIGYCTVFIATVLTFRKGLIRFQLSQLMWTIVTVLMVVGQCNFFGTNTLNGLFWFFFPMATVVMNDVSAYFCGISMGRRFIKAPFIAISPNKTWEGFIGAAICTLIFSFLFPALLAQWTWFTCPAETLYIYPWPSRLECEPLSIFLPNEYLLPTWFGGGTVTLLPIQLHGLAYGLFASLVAPFGGFLASAIKRAYKIKDFDSFMPGHGGMMDRMDCQLLIVCFTYLHYNTFIVPRVPSVKSLLASAVLLSIEEQIKLYDKLGQSIQETVGNLTHSL
eukprot:gene2115-4132_t